MTKKQGFTLVEIAIVVVIIGILVSGVVVGRSMLRNSQLRAVIGEYTLYTQAIGTFRDKYQALPGDFAGASSIWSGVTNGDGNGLITVNSSGTRLDEQFLAWQHMAKAEMIKGSFTGVAGSAGARDRIPGENVPLSTRAKSGWGLISVTLTDIAGGYAEIPYTAPDTAPNHVLWFGGRSISGTADSMDTLITTIEAAGIDAKNDDGLPGSGKIVAQANQVSKGDCSSSATLYSTATDRISCSLVFKTGY